MCPVPCRIGAGESGSLPPGVTPGTPSVLGTGEGEQTQSGVGSRCIAGRVRARALPKQARQGHLGCAPRSRVSRDAEEEGCTGGHRHWVALLRGLGTETGTRTEGHPRTAIGRDWGCPCEELGCRLQRKG